MSRSIVSRKVSTLGILRDRHGCGGDDRSRFGVGKTDVPGKRVITGRIFAMALLLPGMPAAAQNMASPVTPASVPEKKICKSIVPTGSIMAKKICLTKTDWAKFDESNDRGAVEVFRNKRTMTCGKLDSPLTCNPEP